MTTYLEHNLRKTSTSVSALPRFPAATVGQPLLSIIESDVNGVIIVDAMRRIVLVNDMVERMFGHPPEYLLEKSLDVLLPSRPSRTPARRRNCLTPPLMHGERSTALELKGVHSNGELLTVSASISGVAVCDEFYIALIVKPSIPKGRNQQTASFSGMLAERRRRAVSSQQASEVEKKRFSRKLYDDIGQRLSVLKLDLDWLENSLSDADGCFPARLAQMQGLLDNVISMTKNMASALRPPLLDDFGLLPAVEWMAEAFQKKTSIACIVESTGMAAKLDDAVESVVFRIVQEGLSNIEKHAHARNAKVIFSRSKTRLNVMIRDDGVGMTNDSENKPGCYGLIAMQERIFVLGGTINIRSVKPHGVSIHASIPIEPIFNVDQFSFPPPKNL